MMGRPQTEETRRKISEAKKGKPSWSKGIPKSAEHKAKISAALKGRPKAPFTDEHRRNLSRSKRGDKHPAWSGGRLVNRFGYVMVKVGRDHPMADGQGYALEHRLVVAEHAGRVLHPSEIVHHKNGVRDDNRFENLMLTDRSAHASMHHEMRRVAS